MQRLMDLVTVIYVIIGYVSDNTAERYGNNGVIGGGSGAHNFDSVYATVHAVCAPAYKRRCNNYNR